jgi:hypothetical protein
MSDHLSVGAAGATFLAVAVIFLVFLVFAAAMFVPWVVALVDALRIDDPTWIAAGQSKILWVLLIVFLGLLGAVLYLVMARPALRRQAPTA